MKRFIAALAAFIIVSSVRTVAADDPLLARMTAVNSNLHSYTATMHAHVALTTFPFLSTDIVANVYHKDPDKTKVEITSGLPLIASQFGKLYPRIEPPSLWNDLYTVKNTGDDGARTSYTLLPKKDGNVRMITAVVDDKNATITQMRWSYVNGGSAEMNNTYSEVDGNMVVTAQTGQVNEPNYQGTVSAQLSGYKMNPSLDDSVFDQ